MLMKTGCDSPCGWSACNMHVGRTRTNAGIPEHWIVRIVGLHTFIYTCIHIYNYLI